MMGYEKVGLLTKNDDSAKLTNKVAGATKPVAKTVDCQNKEDTVIGDSQEEEVCVKFDDLAPDCLEKIACYLDTRYIYMDSF